MINDKDALTKRSKKPSLVELFSQLHNARAQRVPFEGEAAHRCHECHDRPQAHRVYVAAAGEVQVRRCAVETR